jgi:hypothetical protein
LGEKNSGITADTWALPLVMIARLPRNSAPRILFKPKTLFASVAEPEGGGSWSQIKEQLD